MLASRRGRPASWAGPRRAGAAPRIGWRRGAAGRGGARGEARCQGPGAPPALGGVRREAARPTPGRRGAAAPLRTWPRSFHSDDARARGLVFCFVFTHDRAHFHSRGAK